jgi:hypothetical protein
MTRTLARVLCCCTHRQLSRSLSLSPPRVVTPNLLAAIEQVRHGNQSVKRQHATAIQWHTGPSSLCAWHSVHVTALGAGDGKGGRSSAQCMCVRKGDPLAIWVCVGKGDPLAIQCCHIGADAQNHIPVAPATARSGGRGRPAGRTLGLVARQCSMGTEPMRRSLAHCVSCFYSWRPADSTL